MYQLIFRDWKIALLWAIGLTASTAAFFERDGGHDQLEASAAQIRAQKAQLAPVPSYAPPSAQPDRADPSPEAQPSGEGGDASVPGDGAPGDGAAGGEPAPDAEATAPA